MAIKNAISELILAKNCNGHEVSYKTFLEPNFSFAGFFSSFRHNPSLYHVPKLKFDILLIFVKNCTTNI